MRVREVMKTRVYSVSPTTPVSKVASMIAQLRISGVPVLDDAKKLVGIVSEKDVIKAMYPSYDELINDPVASRNFEAMEDRYEDLGRILAQEIMTRGVVTVPPEMPALQAGSLMIRERIRRLPVVDSQNGNLLGIITLGDIHQALFSQHFLQEAWEKGITVGK